MKEDTKKLIRTTVYKNGIMNVYEKRTLGSTPIRERDTIIENIFEFVKNKK